MQKGADNALNLSTEEYTTEREVVRGVGARQCMVGQTDSLEM